MNLQVGASLPDTVALALAPESPEVPAARLTLAIGAVATALSDQGSLTRWFASAAAQIRATQLGEAAATADVLKAVPAADVDSGAAVDEGAQEGERTGCGILW